MKKILLAASLMTFAFCVSAQNGVPPNYKLAAAADYAGYEKNVLQTIDWYLSPPVNEKSEEAHQAKKFLLEWMSGSPDLSINISPEIVNFSDLNSDLILVFMAGWTRYALRSRKFDDELNGNIEGVKAVTAYYQKNRATLQHDEHVEAYIKLQKEQKLVEFVKKQMGK
jgi:hypothetical protein